MSLTIDQVNKIKEIEQAFSYLSILGVPKERAGNVVNGIMVYESRMKRERDSLKYRIGKLEEALINYIKKDEEWKSKFGSGLISNITRFAYKSLVDWFSKEDESV